MPRLLTSGYTEIPLLCRGGKKIGETAKSAIWIPLRGVTIRRETTSHEAENAALYGAGERHERPLQPPRVQQDLQFSLNIMISYNVLCRFFFRRHRRRLDVSLPSSIILPVRGCEFLECIRINIVFNDRFLDWFPLCCGFFLLILKHLLIYCLLVFKKLTFLILK